MKKWLYVIAPGAMLAVFLFFYVSSRQETIAREKAKAEEVAQEKADAEAKKKVAEAKAREDADRRTAEREADEAKAALEKEQKYDSDMAAIKADTDKSNALADTYSKQVSDLAVELDSLNKQKDQLTRESFELSKKIELAEVARHNAEMEVQRLVEMIADRADESLMAKMPPPPPPAKDS